MVSRIVGRVYVPSSPVVSVDTPYALLPIDQGKGYGLRTLIEVEAHEEMIAHVDTAIDNGSFCVQIDPVKKLDVCQRL